MVIAVCSHTQSEIYTYKRILKHPGVIAFNSSCGNATVCEQIEFHYIVIIIVTRASVYHYGCRWNTLDLCF